MKILLTGATGFVGRNFMARAVQNGAEIMAPVRNADKLARILAEDGVDPAHVSPLPADPQLWESMPDCDRIILSAGALFERNLAEFCATNVDWTLEVLRHLPHQCPCVVLSSQSAGGPTPWDRDARDEACGDEPISAYGESKLRMERAIRREFGRDRAVFLRPPMILGPKDTAIDQLFQMAAGWIRTKPGLKTKTFSFIACNDLLDAINTTFEHFNDLKGEALYVASTQKFTDWQLISAAAATISRHGISLPIPQPIVQLAAALIDRIPGLRKKFPSLTRERVKEVWPNRWVVDPTKFSTRTGWSARLTLAAALDLSRKCNKTRL
jgi:nucleoside-diphosphate-sugar epimerase